MPFVRIPRTWEIPERMATPEAVHASRRRFLGLAGLGSLALATGACAAESPPGGSTQTGPALAGGSSEPAAGAMQVSWPEPYLKGLYPASRNPAYKLDREITDEQVASSTINYYEFTTDKGRVAEMARGFPLHPWSLEVTGLVHAPRTWAAEDLIRAFPLQERLYRHRCVEAWAMAVPWTGLPLSRFIDACKPLGSARYVRFVSFMRPEDAPAQRQQPWYPWPYFEALTMAEATNELALLATGIYGHPLPSHHGAPLRLVVPWKYGYKSIKGIVKVEFTAEQPKTFWNELAPSEYDFTSNVDPTVPHPRWSQANERLIGTGERVDTLPYNGYGAHVAHLYKSA